MSDHLAVLRKVGVVLIAVGVADIAYMAYCIAQGQGYASGFNVFAVIAGVFLWHGHLGAVRVVTRFAAFLATAGVGAVLLLAPMRQSTDLWLVELKLSPVATLASMTIAVAMVGLLVWVYTQLRAGPVLQALRDAGRPTSAPRLPLAAGAVLPVALAVVFHLTLAGSSGAKAVELARARYGNQYRYVPSAINWAGRHVSARLTAYNEREVKSVVVEWSE